MQCKLANGRTHVNRRTDAVDGRLLLHAIVHTHYAPSPTRPSYSAYQAESGEAAEISVADQCHHFGRALMA